MSNEEQNSQNVTENTTTTTQGETKKCKYCQSDIPKKQKFVLYVKTNIVKIESKVKKETKEEYSTYYYSYICYLIFYNVWYNVWVTRRGS